MGLRKRQHIRLLVLATLIWVGFLAGGLPHYYQQYSTRFMVCFDLAALVLIGGTVALVLRRVKSKRIVGMSLWLAFYFTVPLAIYDWLLCGIYLEHGLRFLLSFWYLSVFYVIPWILFPAVALGIRRKRATPGRRHSAPASD